MVTYELKNGLYNGTVPIPAKYLNIAGHLDQSLQVLNKGKKMTITDLKSFVDSREFPDKFRDGFYKLYYYRWKEDGKS